MANQLTFSKGVKDGLPIGLGYLSVAFAFGVKASLLNVPIYITLLISMTNLTSAGQLAGLDIVAVCGSFIEIILIQLVINSRYALMSLTLTQKVDESFTTKHRLLGSAFITDEIFAVASSKGHPVNTKYYYGLAFLPYIGWATGTLIGALAGNILPDNISNALGLAMYAMFIAIITMPSVKEFGVLLAVLISAGISCAIKFIPTFSFITSGFAIIISALLTACIVAAIKPVKFNDDEEGKANE